MMTSSSRQLRHHKNAYKLEKCIKGISSVQKLKSISAFKTYRSF